MLFIFFPISPAYLAISCMGTRTYIVVMKCIARAYNTEAQRCPNIKSGETWSQEGYLQQERIEPRRQAAAIAKRHTTAYPVPLNSVQQWICTTKMTNTRLSRDSNSVSPGNASTSELNEPSPMDKLSWSWNIISIVFDIGSTYRWYHPRLPRRCMTNAKHTNAYARANMHATRHATIDVYKPTQNVRPFLLIQSHIMVTGKPARKPTREKNVIVSRWYVLAIIG